MALLGPVELRIGGPGERPAALARMPRHLLVALALAPGRVVSTDALSEALWDDDPPDSATATLQTYVSLLRRALGDRQRREPTLRRQGDGYVLDIDPAAVDAVRFERLVAEADGRPPAVAEPLLAEALALWRGPALGDVAAEAFARPAAARLESQRLAAVEARIDAALALGRHAALVPELEELVGNHPLRERFTAQLMTALARSGRQADALRAYARTRAVLLDELGIDPSAELVDLEGAILRQEAGEAPASPHPARPAPPGPGPGSAAGGPGSGSPGPTLAVDLPLPPAATPPARRLAAFVGRGSELDRVVATWARRDGGRRVLAVSGDAGIGKSRLVTELAARAHGSGGLVLWGGCTSGVSAPYQPFVEALRPLVAAVGESIAGLGYGGHALARLLPELGPPGGAGGGPTGADDRSLLFDAVAALLARAAGRRPTLLVVDDLHWADASTCALVSHLARHPDLDGLLLALTYRPAEAQRPHPAADTLADLRRARVVEQLPLSGLDGEATAALVRALAGDRAGEIEDLQARTEGNPFFVEEFVAHALDHAGDGGLPGGVRDIVERRLAELADDDRRVLAAAAVLGATFDADVLGAVVGRDPLALVDSLEEAVRLHLVVEAAPPVGRFAFGHALIRDGLLEQMTLLRRSQVHRAAADAIDAATDDEGIDRSGTDRSAELADHLVAAGPAVAPERVVAALWRAARHALDVASYDEAQAACEQALALVEGTGDGAELGVLLTLGAVRSALAGVVEARPTYRRAAELAVARGDGVGLAYAAVGGGAGSGVGVAAELRVVDDERRAWLERALVLLGDDQPALRVRVLAHLTTVLYDADPERCLATSAQAVAEAEALGEPTYTSAAHIGRRIALWRPDADMGERLAAGARAVAEGDVEGDVLYVIVSRLAHLSDLLEAAELDRFDAVLAEAEAAARPLRQGRWDWFCDVAASGRLLATGRYAEGVARAERALAGVGRAHGSTPPLTHASLLLAYDRDRGDTAPSVGRLAALGPPDDVPGVIRAAHALATVEAGDPAGGAALAGPITGAAAAGLTRDYLWLGAMALLGEVAHRLGDAEAAAALDAGLAGFDGRLVAVGGAASYGLVARVRGLLAATAGDLDAAADRLAAAHAGHVRLGLRPWAARTAAELAAVLRDRGAAGDAGRADALAAEAAATAAALGIPVPRTGPAQAPPIRRRAGGQVRGAMAKQRSASRPRA